MLATQDSFVHTLWRGKTGGDFFTLEAYAYPPTPTIPPTPPLPAVQEQRTSEAGGTANTDDRLEQEWWGWPISKLLFLRFWKALYLGLSFPVDLADRLFLEVPGVSGSRTWALKGCS